METIRIAVGSKRAPKIEAVREALDAWGPLLHPKCSFEVREFEVATGVAHTPRSRTELMAGARGRCEALMRLGSEPATFLTARRHPEGASRPGALYLIGLEGGL